MALNAFSVEARVRRACLETHGADFVGTQFSAQDFLPWISHAKAQRTQRL